MPDLPCRGGGVNPTSMAQNDTHVALIMLTTQCGGGGGELLVEKTFSGQILCSCAFGANIRSYTKQRARHGTPFLQPPSPSADVHVTPPPPRRAIFRSPRGHGGLQCPRATGVEEAHIHTHLEGVCAVSTARAARSQFYAYSGNN